MNFDDFFIRWGFLPQKGKGKDVPGSKWDVLYKGKEAVPEPKREKWISAGGVILDSLSDLDKVWVIKPANQYGPWGFPKGRIDPGESMEKAAVREVGEETGLKVRILPGSHLGSFEGGFSHTNFFVMVRTGGSPSKHDEEVEKVALVSFRKAAKLFTSRGNKRDIHVLNKAQMYLEKHMGKKFEEAKDRHVVGRDIGDAAREWTMPQTPPPSVLSRSMRLLAGLEVDEPSSGWVLPARD